MSTEHKCSATIKRKVVQQGRADGLYDLYGRKISLPEGTQETPSVEETTISCPGCGIEKVIPTTGIGFAPYNEANRLVEEYLKTNCPKRQAKPAEALAKAG